MEKEMKNKYDEKVLKPMNGWLMMAIYVLLLLSCILLISFGHVSAESGTVGAAAMLIIGYLLLVPICILPSGFRMLSPNEALVSTLFGKYYGSIKKEGFFWINPFCVSFNPANKNLFNNQGVYVPIGKKLSLKAMTLNNEKQKVNDLEGNPIEIGVVVIWKIADTAKAAFNVDNYANYVSIQSDAAIRNIARQYPYDVSEGGDEKSLRGSSQEIADMLCEDLQKRVEIAGVEIVEARIAHLAYSQEIAAAMLQRQQAKAVVDARTTIVEGAVGMVELALEKLAENGVVKLDEEKKAQMVSNLMVVLCSNKDTQPIVNSGSIN